VLPVRDPAPFQQLAFASQAVAVAMFLGAGSLFLSRWRIDGDPRTALAAVALLVYGAGAIVPRYLALVLGVDVAPSIIDEIGTSAVVGVVLVISVRTVVSADYESINLARLLGAGLTLTAATWFLLLALESQAPQALAAGASMQSAVNLVLALVWTVLGALAWRRRHAQPWMGRIGVLVGGLAVVRLLDATAGSQADAPAHLGAMLLWATVACVTAYCALVTLHEVVEDEQAQLQTVVDALSEANVGVARRDAWREELSHDAINALAGLRAALTTLQRYEHRLDAEAVRRLRGAVIAEVVHLEHLVERSTRDYPEPFELAEVICNVVETRRATGLQVRLGPVQGRVLGRPGDLSTVLQNLLINAARHAPGSRVDIRVIAVPGRVGVQVADRGPGIPAELADWVFERGFRGPGSGSTGLGLFVARELMREQGGELELVSTAGGCVFLATLPSADPDGVRSDDRTGSGMVDARETRR